VFRILFRATKNNEPISLDFEVTYSNRKIFDVNINGLRTNQPVVINFDANYESPWCSYSSGFHDPIKKITWADVKGDVWQ